LSGLLGSLAGFGLAACAIIGGVGAQSNPTPAQSQVVAKIRLPDGPPPLAMAVGDPGQLWLTRAGSPDNPPVVGELLRVDASAGQAVLAHPIGGDPEAVAFAGASVWVVNGFGDGKTQQADANTVVELDPTTADEVERYQVDQPFGVAAAGGRAWITAAGPGATTLITLVQAHTVTAGSPLIVAGGNAGGQPSVVVGGDAAFVVTSVSESGQAGRNVIYAVDGTGQVTAQQTLPTFGNAALAFDAGGAMFATIDNVQAGGIYRMDSATLGLNATFSNAGARGITTANGHVWALSLDGSSVQQYDAAAGLPVGQQVQLPGHGSLIAADDQQVWVATEQVGINQLVLIAPS
jgi:hypothetical protein